MPSRIPTSLFSPSTYTTLHEPAGHSSPASLSRPYAAAALASAQAPTSSKPHIQTHHPLQPPSLKPAQLRKSQLLRAYVSLLRSSAARSSSSSTPTSSHQNGSASDASSPERSTKPARVLLRRRVRLTAVQGAVFGAAIRIAEFARKNPGMSDERAYALSEAVVQRDTAVEVRARQAPACTACAARRPDRGVVVSVGGYSAAGCGVADIGRRCRVGQVLERSPAPKRKDAPGLYEPGTQNGLAKLMLLGARVEDKVLDGAGARWVGWLARCRRSSRTAGGIVTRIGMGLVGTLEGQRNSLYLTLEGRRMAMEDEAKSQTPSE
ncbi:hypothetical protein MRB53_039522 [Persea americana]|nr:hypothetical protein MRB53_039522 [Persea americana]